MKLDLKEKINIAGIGEIIVGYVLEPKIDTEVKVGKLVGKIIEFQGAKYRVHDIEYHMRGFGRVNPRQSFGFLVKQIL
jgi:hypothetical protein